ncbi:HER211Cp [Eremothecium sinecaudum]|uniref:HER211Cp n=1 Tax=Eremothecium sinecaudum TaxID=45286 RepID=A0A0X8HU47_9SACH|nr:HER211Cp [Eremothecium sinecaudum]AMD21489.1 HER211Cp [Eremothecium sinecaudum]
MRQSDELLSPSLTLQELQHALTHDSGTRAELEARISNVRDSVLPVRLLFNDFLRTLAQIDQLGDRSPQEKFALVRTKLLELHSRVRSLVGDFQALKPLLNTMSTYSETRDQKFSPLETLSLSSETVKPLGTSPAYRKPAVTPGSNAPTPAAAAALAAGVASSGGSSSTAAVGGITQFPGTIPHINPGVSPLTMLASPLAGISPGRKVSVAQQSQQKQPAVPHKAPPNKTPVINSTNLSPQSILNMSAAESVGANTIGMAGHMGTAVAGPVGTGIPDLDALDLNSVELGSLNLDLLG